MSRINNAVRHNTDYFVSVLLLLQPCFKHLMPTIIGLPLFFIGFMLLLLLHCKPSQIALRSLSFIPIVGLSVLGTLLNGVVDSDYYLFVFGALAFALASGDTRWVKPFFIVFLVMCLIHCLATISFYLFPDFGRQIIQNSLLSQYPTARDYRSALSGSYSWNGMYTSLCFILSSGVAFSGSRHSKIGCLLCGISAIALLLTTKRAHLMFSIAAFTLMFYLANRTKGISKFVKFCLIVLLILIAFGISSIYFPQLSLVFDRFSETSGNADELLSGRTYLWQHALDQWTNKPIFGQGWASYKFSWIDGGTPVVSVAAHCVLLQLLAETGLFGLSLAIIPFIILIKGAFETSIHLDSYSAGTRSLVLASAGIVAFFILYSFCGNPLYDSPMFISMLAIFSFYTGSTVFI